MSATATAREAPGSMHEVRREQMQEHTLPADGTRQLMLKVLAFIQIHPGKENAVTGAQIAGEFGIVPQTVRAIINELRTCGQEVGSTPFDGYFWTVRATEAVETLRHIDSRLVHQGMARKGFARKVSQKFTLNVQPLLF